VQRGQPGCIDCLELFAPHVRSWITNSQETLCATCRSLEATTELSSLASVATQVRACPQRSAVAIGGWAHQGSIKIMPVSKASCTVENTVSSLGWNLSHILRPFQLGVGCHDFSCSPTITLNLASW
jgi:hypothetical protein